MVSYHSAFGNTSPVDQYDFPTKCIPVEHVKNIETATDEMTNDRNTWQLISKEGLHCNEKHHWEEKGKHWHYISLKSMVLQD